LKQSKLPPRWRRLHGAIYYRVPKGQEHQWDGKQTFRLGKNESEAWRTWVERIPLEPGVTTMNQVFDRWWNEYVMVHLKESTHDSYFYHLFALRKVFGGMRPGAIKPVHAYQYRAKRPRVAGNREVSVLSSALTFAVGCGLIDHNPLRGQLSRRGTNSEPSRKRVPTSDELDEFCEVNPHLKGYVDLKRITGLRQGQLLAINLTEHWDGKVLHPPTSKGGRDTRYSGVPLHKAIKQIIGARIPKGALFVNRRGVQVTASGFRSAWRRAMGRYSGVGGEPFHEHDIRKYVATKASSMEHAQQLMGHQDQKTTAQVYRIGAIVVEVLE